MGFAYADLIPAAILLDNPGITREELMERVDNTHACSWHGHSEDAAWDDYDAELEAATSDMGLENLAWTLGLNETPQFWEFMRSYQHLAEQHGISGLTLRPTKMRLPAREEAQTGFSYEVTTATAVTLQAPRRFQEYWHEQLRVGDVWSEEGTSLRAVVLAIHEECRMDTDEDSPYQWEYVMDVQPFRVSWNIQGYRTEEELWRDWPQFHPDLRFDWDKSHGSITGGLFGIENFMWQQQHGRYSLDPRTFDKIPASNRADPKGNLGYTNLIFTAEAVKKSAWKLLSHGGTIYCEPFLRDFPDSNWRIDQAIWDAHTSMYAKSQGMTHSELLRFRLEPHQ